MNDYSFPARAGYPGRGYRFVQDQQLYVKIDHIYIYIQISSKPVGCLNGLTAS